MRELREVVPTGGPQALVVGLEEAFGAAVAAELESRGWSVTLARGGRDALSCWPALYPDAIVVDLEGGDMDAIEFVQALAALGRRPPVLACAPSPSTPDLDPAALRELGIDALLARPCRVDSLAEALAALTVRLEARPRARAV